MCARGNPSAANGVGAAFDTQESRIGRCSDGEQLARLSDAAWRSPKRWMPAHTALRKELRHECGAEQQNESESDREQRRIGSARSGHRQRGECARTIRFALVRRFDRREGVHRDRNRHRLWRAHSIGAEPDRNRLGARRHHVARWHQSLHAHRHRNQHQGQQRTCMNQIAERTHAKRLGDVVLIVSKKR